MERGRVRGKVRLAAMALAALAAVAPVRGLAETVTAAAVFRPDPGFFERFHKQCDGRRLAVFDACFAAAMAQAGASPQALDFTRALGNQAYLQALEPTGGRIAIAHVFYPFRANENDTWLLVNGTPPLIDVDDLKKLSAQLPAAPAYREIRRHYPKVSFWPGDRGVNGPQVTQNGREVVVGYVLRDLCHACAIIGWVRYAFDFDSTGKFLEARLLSINPVNDQGGK
jgi:hypothetical protein